jgi:hypothetical protein
MPGLETTQYFKLAKSSGEVDGKNAGDGGSDSISSAKLPQPKTHRLPSAALMTRGTPASPTGAMAIGDLYQGVIRCLHVETYS